MINNAWTFSERRHQTLRDLLRGFALFVAISACGAFINQSVTWYLEHLGAMLSLAMVAGIATSTVWNYFLNLDLTWKGHARPE